MAKSVLVIDSFADVYARELRQRFPALVVHTASTEADVTAPLAGIDVLVSFGNGLTNELYRAMPRLAWVQSLATGTDQFLRHPAFRRETIITSARGIHDAPMRETVLYLMLGISPRSATASCTTRTRNDGIAASRGRSWPARQPSSSASASAASASRAR